MDRAASAGLRAVLARVSRTFALSIRALPAGLRGPVEIAYLLARAADTVADRAWIPNAERLRRLDELLGGLAGGPLDSRAWSRLADCAPGSDATAGAEAALLQAAPALVEHCAGLPADDHRDVVDVVRCLIETMEDELRRFPPEAPLTALPNAASLTAYTEGIAGVVGVFWTRLIIRRGIAPASSGPSLRIAGRRYGRGLQLVNVLRDLPRDLRRGRCFLPADELAAAGLSSADLLDPRCLPRLRPILARWEARSRAGLLTGLVYATRLPTHHIGVRAATALPARLGLLTLERLRGSDARLDPGVSVRVTRVEVRRAVAATLLLAPLRRGPLRLAQP